MRNPVTADDITDKVMERFDAGVAKAKEAIADNASHHPLHAIGLLYGFHAGVEMWMRKILQPDQADACMQTYYNAIANADANKTIRKAMGGDNVG